MDVLYQACCGLDVHEATVVACVRRPGSRGRRAREVRTFGTVTAQLLELTDWLREQRVTHVAMESTGVLWVPVFNLLEDSFEVLLVNARHMKTVPGRKTDVKDCEWLAELLEHGLLRPSFIPPRPIRELRELTRYRKSLVDQRAHEVNRVQKVLETANIKLVLVATDVLGASGRAMLRALQAGERDGARLAELAKGTLRRKRERLAEALTGRFSEHHAVLLAHIEYLEAAIERVSQRIDAALVPYADQVQRLQAIPGVARQGAETIIAEIGVDMTRFPSAAHLASWAGHLPGKLRVGGQTPTRHDPSRRSVAEIPAGRVRVGALAAPAAPTWARSTPGWRTAAARRRRRWPWATASWSPPTTSCATVSATGTWARTTSTSWPRND